MLSADASGSMDRPFATLRIRRMFWVNVGITLAGIAAAVATWESSDWASLDLILIVTAFAVASELLAYGA